MSRLFTPFRLRELEFRNRVFVSPMCQYSSPGGLPTDWHLVHLGSRAVGGAALVMTEATAVSPEGRISPDDTGIWSGAHTEAWRRVALFIRGQGARAAMQLAHAGRKASTQSPWDGDGAVPEADGGWQPMGPSPIAFDSDSVAPREMTLRDIDDVVKQFADAARRAFEAGFETVEIHAAHGYLLHEFLSPISNKRSDEYGGPLENRMRLAVRVAAAVRAVIPQGSPLLTRISATDWVDGGWDLPQSIELSKKLKEAGVDLIDCSSGGSAAHAKIPVAQGYQVPFAEAIRRDAGIATGAVGMITRPEQAEEIIASGKADVVLLAREMLRDPYWPLHAARALGDKVAAPRQYGRAL
ncbi:MAG TPA: NADH:flavin oxidoreductase/NADH oxidase [Opitutaceae bacterium]|jgi:2,4-dienoyl-CoA reductase-like NADH-dependent reductase (Old Yellow Enzyme family)